MLSLEALEGRELLTTITVTSLSDAVSPPQGVTTLREAITEANTFASILNSVTIDFQQGLTGTVNPTSPLPAIDGYITLSGPGAAALTISGVTGGSTITVATNAKKVMVSGLTLGSGGGIPGLGVEVGATATLESSVVTGFAATGTPGGSIAILGGNLTIIDTTVSGAVGAYGSGIFVEPSANHPSTLKVLDSTISGNQGGGLVLEGVTGSSTIVQTSTIANNGGLYNSTGGGIYVTGAGNSLTVESSTIAGNVVGRNASSQVLNAGQPYPAGGIFVGSSSTAAVIQDSIIAGNSQVTAFSGSTITATMPADVSGPVDPNSSYNVVGNGTYELIPSGNAAPTTVTEFTNGVNGNQVGSATVPINPDLGPLQNNGGPTDTMALLPGSVAIDRGHAILGLSTDQRGLTRINDIASIANAVGGDGSDAGAYEVSGTLSPTVLTVNSTSDVNAPAGVLTLRQAIEAADGMIALSTLPSSQVSVGSPYLVTIDFSVAGTITLASALPELSTDITLQGPGAALLTIAGVPNTGATLYVAPSTNAVSISGVTIVGASSTAGLLVGTGAFATISDSIVSGSYSSNATGNIWVDGGDLTVSRCTVAGAHTGAYGIYVSSTSGNSTLDVVDSTIDDNAEGGILLQQGAVSTTITNSTIADNGGTASASMGGIHVSIGYASLTISGSTIANNIAYATSAAGAGLFIEAGSSASLVNTIIAANQHGSAVNGGVFTTTSDDVLGAVAASSSFNLIGNGSGLTGITNGVNGNQIGTSTAPINPLLGPLQDNGGPTPTMELLPGSPAINTGSGQSATSDPDQRGVARATIANIGAYQATASAYSFFFPSPTTAGQTQRFAVDVTDSLGQIAYGYTGTAQFSSSDSASILPSTSSFYNGFGYFRATLKTAGSQALSVTDTSNAILSSTQSGIVVNAAAPSSIAVYSGGGQSAVVTSNFANPLEVIVKDAFGNPVAGVSVLFTVQPYTNASGSFGGSTTATVTTDANGIATAPTLTANSFASANEFGSYLVNATTAALPNSVTTFTLTNVAAAAITSSAAMNLPALQGDTTGTMTLAIFNDPDLALFRVQDYTAAITWGDGTSGTGNVSVVNGELVVSGAHTFSTAGMFGTRVVLTHGPTSRTSILGDRFTVAPDLAGKVSEVGSGLVFNRKANEYTGSITLTNIGTSSLSGEIELVFAGLPSFVTLANASGTTASGLPYLLVALSTPLAPGQSIKVSVAFTNTSNLLFSYALRAYGISG